mmetsp:Transcript_757/g.2937  ORF Transcript_757/g.2937 Transcript_757/m.2937 type:complete len:294 (-) Transcript_757:1060-1941(-)
MRVLRSLNAGDAQTIHLVLSQTLDVRVRRAASFSTRVAEQTVGTVRDRRREGFGDQRGVLFVRRIRRRPHPPGHAFQLVDRQVHEETAAPHTAPLLHRRRLGALAQLRRLLRLPFRHRRLPLCDPDCRRRGLLHILRRRGTHCRRRGGLRLPRRRRPNTRSVTVPRSHPHHAGLLVVPKVPGVREPLAAPVSARQGFLGRRRFSRLGPLRATRLLLAPALPTHGCRHGCCRRSAPARSFSGSPDDLRRELSARRVSRRQSNATLGRPGPFDVAGLPSYVYPAATRCHARRASE